MVILEEHFTTVAFSNLWLWLRYLILFPIMFLFVVSIYAVTTPRDKKKFRKGIGALAASIVMVGTSMAFSWMMSATNRYTLVYGSLASVVILMIWLFALGIILICGNVINVIIDRRKREKYNEAQA
jgi:membrane protein